MPKQIPEDHLLEVSRQLKADHQLMSPSKSISMIETPKIIAMLPKRTMTYIRSRRKKSSIFISFILFIVALVMLLGWIWYSGELQPIDVNSSESVLVDIKSGMNPSEIGGLLESSGLIRNTFVFDIYTRLSSTRAKLQAGTFRLHKKDSLPQIVDSIANGKASTMNVQFLPGDTLTGHKKKLLALGYTLDEINRALSATYLSTIFAGKPASADLEGYIYGETYFMASNASVSDILDRSFAEMESVISKNDLKAKFERHGLTLFEGITLASIVQREVASPSGLVPSSDQRQVAQVFYSRLALGMPLGSDVTYQYIADKMGVTRDPNLDSPYNTRKYAGLPPGPISSPGLTALLAVADPSDTNYLYFLSGDDNVTYFAHNDAEHQQNIINHCHQKCQLI